MCGDRISTGSGEARRVGRRDWRIRRAGEMKISASSMFEWKV